MLKRILLYTLICALILLPVPATARPVSNVGLSGVDKTSDISQILAEQAEIADAAGQAGAAVAKTVGDISLAMYAETGDERWAEGGIYHTLLNTAGAAMVAGIGNGEGLNAAIGAMASQLAAGKIQEFADEIAKQFSDDVRVQDFLSNMVTNIAKGGIGALVGGETEASLATVIDAYNRQLHEEEFQRLKELAKGDDETLAKLSLVACAKVKCYLQLQPGSDEYNAVMKVLEGVPGFEDEWALLADQAIYSEKPAPGGANGALYYERLFQYTLIDMLNDEYQLDIRLEGAGRGLVNSTLFVGSWALTKQTAGLFAIVSAAFTGILGDSGLYNGLAQLGLSHESARYLELALASAPGWEALSRAGWGLGENPLPLLERT